MNPGKFRHRITFMQKGEGQDEYGAELNNWTPFCSAWASKDHLLGNEYFNALTTNTKVEVKFNMRYIPSVTNEMRIQHGAEMYEILSVINVKSLNREMLCYCKLVK